MLIRESPIPALQQMNQQQQQQQAPMSPLKRGTAAAADFASSNVEDDMLKTLAAPAPLHSEAPPQVVQSLVRQHQFAVEDFEPNPVYNPAIPPPLPVAALPLSNARLVPAPLRPQSFDAGIPGQISFPTPQQQQQQELVVPKPMDRRKQFLIFVKILLKHLEKNSEQALQQQTKRILTECIRQNRLGHPDYVPLHLAAEARVLPIVGPRHWNRSLDYLNLYLKKEARAQFERRQPPPPTLAAPV